jgi:hypothetical protein
MDNKDSPYLPPVFAMLDEYGTTVATGRAPDRDHEQGRYYAPEVRIFTAQGEGSPAQSITISRVEGIKELGRLCVEVSGMYQPAMETRLKFAKDNWEWCLQQIETMRRVLPQFGIVNIDGDCAFELYGGGHGFSWDGVVEDLKHESNPHISPTGRALALRDFLLLWPTAKDGTQFLMLCEHSGV